MKILFAGPSLYRTDWSAGRVRDGVDCRGPAAQGDIARAVVEGAAAIGLVDGRYEDIAAVWHKEILYAIEQGVPVFGAASMGALRAAECADFGMIGLGAVYERYRSGGLADDAAVAQLHAPAELGYLHALIRRFWLAPGSTAASAARRCASSSSAAASTRSGRMR
jgi:hypothetical protein